MRAVVSGNWHLASVYAVGLCKLGYEITLLCNTDVRGRYESGKAPVYEPEIDENISLFQREKKISFVSDIKDVLSAETCFFAEDCKVNEGGVDLELLERFFSPIAKSRKFNTIVISSQVPLGTCKEWQKKYPEIKILYFPEFLRLGDALSRFLNPDYIVIGGDTDASSKVLSFFDKMNCPKFQTTWEEAEMTKHAANALVATTVSFVSELTKFSEKYNVNLDIVGKILKNDARIGKKAYVMPGMGFSGETVERDIRVLLSLADKNNIKLPLLEQVIRVNDEHNMFVENKLRKKFKTFKGAKIGFLGATYKPFTSTLRGSIFYLLMEKLQKEGATIKLFDPHVSDQLEFITADVSDVFRQADAVVICVNKDAFRRLDYRKLATLMKDICIIDAGNVLAPNTVAEMKETLGADYASIGRGVI